MKKVGIIGGGQLGKMMILDGKRLDTWFSILDPTENCPAHSIADRHIVAGFDDVDAILEMAEGMDVVTYEFEHISLRALQLLEEHGHKVYPSSETLGHIQDKFVQKSWLRKHGIPVPDFMRISSVEDIYAAEGRYGYPMILKTCTGGYDGKGNAVIMSHDDAARAFEALGGGRIGLMLEERIDFEKEVSILACGNENGDVSVFPVAENVHKDSILDETTVPAAIPKTTEAEAFEVAKACLKAFKAVGMLCMELFVTKEGHILVNELAPRPHNSGHYTIEGCYTSQFEQHVRAILGYPLGDASLIRPTAMKNLIGDRDGEACLTGLDEAYRLPFLKIHNYGKEQVRRGRKMGHVTATADTLDEALAAVRQAHDVLRF
jgi:5-(carboxyamino)imidazole ribonucleotide synthase